MPSIHKAFLRQARRGASSVGLLIFGGGAPLADESGGGGELIYRLRLWPELAETYRTASVYRVLSVMSNRPVNRHWIISQSHLSPEQVDALLAWLVGQEAVEVIDSSRFHPAPDTDA